MFTIPFEFKLFVYAPEIETTALLMSLPATRFASCRFQTSTLRKVPCGVHRYRLANGHQVPTIHAGFAADDKR